MLRQRSFLPESGHIESNAIFAVSPHVADAGNYPDGSVRSEHDQFVSEVRDFRLSCPVQHPDRGVRRRPPTGRTDHQRHPFLRIDGCDVMPQYSASRYHGNLSGCSSLSEGNIPFSMMTSASRDAHTRQSVRRAQWPESSHHKHYTTNVALGCIPGVANQCRFRSSGRAAAHAMPPPPPLTRNDFAGTTESP